MPKVTFLPDGSEVDVREGLSLFAAAIESDAEVESQCGGRGGCALCRVIIREGAENLSEMQWEEEAHLGNVFHVTHERLACQSRVKGDVVVEIPEPIERNKKPYVPHRVRRNLEQMVQARLEAAESEQDGLRAVKGKTRRRRRRRGRGPLESTGEMKAVSGAMEAVSGSMEAAEPASGEVEAVGPEGGRPGESQPKKAEGEPRKRRRSRRRRRPRRRRGGGKKPSGSAKGDGGQG